MKRGKSPEIYQAKKQPCAAGRLSPGPHPHQSELFSRRMFHPTKSNAPSTVPDHFRVCVCVRVCVGLFSAGARASLSTASCTWASKRSTPSKSPTASRQASCTSRGIGQKEDAVREGSPSVWLKQRDAAAAAAAADDACIILQLYPQYEQFYTVR